MTRTRLSSSNRSSSTGRSASEVPDDAYEVQLGEAAVRREGADISVYTYGAMTRPTLEAAENWPRRASTPK